MAPCDAEIAALPNAGALDRKRQSVGVYRGIEYTRSVGDVTRHKTCYMPGTPRQPGLAGAFRGTSVSKISWKSANQCVDWDEVVSEKCPGLVAATMMQKITCARPYASSPRPQPLPRPLPRANPTVSLLCAT